MRSSKVNRMRAVAGSDVRRELKKVESRAFIASFVAAEAVAWKYRARVSTRA
jgi:hypothetical protein